MAVLEHEPQVEGWATQVLELILDLGTAFAWRDAQAWCAAHRIAGDDALDVIAAAQLAQRRIAEAEAAAVERVKKARGAG